MKNRKPDNPIHVHLDDRASRENAIEIYKKSCKSQWGRIATESRDALFVWMQKKAIEARDDAIRLQQNSGGDQKTNDANVRAMVFDLAQFAALIVENEILKERGK